MNFIDNKNMYPLFDYVKELTSFITNKRHSYCLKFSELTHFLYKTRQIRFTCRM